MTPPPSDRRPLCWAGLLIVVFCALPLAASSLHPDWLVRVWNTEDGLAGNNVTGLAEDREGFIWLAAGGHLARFDGVQMTDFSHVGLPAEQGGRLRTVQSLRNGDLALLTQDGFVARAGGGKVTTFSAELPGNRADALVEDREGALLIAYQSGAVTRWHDGRLEQLGDDHGLPRSRSRCSFVVDRDGILWFAKGGALGVVRNGRFETLLQLEEPSLRLAASHEGGVWISARLRLLHYREGGELHELGQIPASNPEASSSCLLEDRAGAVWIGTSIGGLYRFDGDIFTHVAVSHREIVTLAEDLEGNLWVGTSGGGVNQVQPRLLRIEGEETGLPFRAVQAVCEDPSGQIWAITQDGLLVTRSGDGWRNVFGPGEGIAGEATCIAADPTGAIWIGTRNHRLHRWWRGKLDTWDRTDGLISPFLRTLLVDQAGDLWIAGGRPASLQRLRHDRLEHFPVPDRADSLWALAAAPGGDVWAGGGGSTLLRVNPSGEVIDETPRTGSPANAIRALHATADGSLWIGYDRGGLGRLNGAGFTRITARDGLVDDNLRLIIADRQGWLWFSAVTAAFKIRQEEIEAFASNRIERVQAVQYGRDQGLHVILGGSVGALLGRDGRLWLPLATSLAVISPESRLRRTDAPPVVVTRVAVDDAVLASFGGPLPPPQGVDVRQADLRLPPDHRRVDLDFAALSLSTPGNIRFRYRLDRFDERWIEAGDARRASYSRLTAGSYRFFVNATSGDGLWSESGTSFAFVVQPFLWETWWFRATLLVLFTTSVFAVARVVATRRVHARLRALEQQTALERERTRIARDIHDDLGSRLTKIALLGGLASRERAEPERVGERLTEISNTARQLIKSLDETVWAVNPRNDTLPHLVTYLGQFASQFLATAEIACVLDLPDDPPQRPVSAEMRHHLFLAVKEALTNVVKHAHARSVHFSVVVKEEDLTVTIADNGIGCERTPGDPEADGLRNMRQRMEAVRGRFDLSTAPSEGTRIRFQIPLNGRPLRA